MPLRASIPEASTPLRLPASYAETIAICRAMECLPPTRLSDLRTRVCAAVAVHAAPRACDDGGRRAMMVHRRVDTAAQLRDRGAPGAGPNSSAGLTSSITDVTSAKIGCSKGRLILREARSTGWRTSSTHMLQPLGHDHNDAHWDYPGRRLAPLGAPDGAEVDLLDVLVARGFVERWPRPIAEARVARAAPSAP
jgi:hypothetical protein